MQDFNWRDVESACPKLGDIGDQVTSAANRAVDAIKDSLPTLPTSGSVGEIASKISESISTVKAEAEEKIAELKAAAGEISQTLQEYAEEIQGKIEEIREQLVGAVGELREELLQQIENLKGELNEVIPSWMHKTPEELLDDVVNGFCDPEVAELGVPDEGIAKKLVPTESPTVNPTTTDVEEFAPIVKTAKVVNPIKL